MSELAFHFEPTEATITQVREYAGKSMAPTMLGNRETTQLDIAPYGPVLDGVPDRWAVAAAVTDKQARKATMVSQRGWSPTSQSVDYPGDSNLALVRTNVFDQGKLHIAIPGDNPFIVEVEDANETDFSDQWRVGIHKGIYVAADLGEAAAAHLTDFLHSANPDQPKREIRLFGAKMDGWDRRTQRLVREEYRLPDFSMRVNGADGAAVLVVNDDTLRAMREQFGLSEEWLDVARARANIVLRGLGVGAERFIKAIRIGNLVMANVGPSSRCVETGVDPNTAERDDNRFLKVLAQAGHVGWSAATGSRGMFFGTNFQPDLSDDETVRIGVGDQVEVAWSESSDVLAKKPGNKQ